MVHRDQDGKQWSIPLITHTSVTTDLILLRVISYGFQVTDQKLQSVEVIIWQIMDLKIK